MRLLRRLSAGLLLAAFAASAAAPHRHPLFDDVYESGAVGVDHVHVLSSHNPLSRATHFHAILGTERDQCAACHGIRGLELPTPAATLGASSALGSFVPRPTTRSFGPSFPSASPRAPPTAA